MNRKSFTLIELLIVVAIMGVLSAVMLPMFQSYTSNSKNEAVVMNHNQIKSVALQAVNICSESGSEQIEFTDKSFKCSALGISKGVVFYANNVLNIKNPHNGKKCCKDKGFPEVGYSTITESDRAITITTKYLKDGKGKYLLDVVNVTLDVF